MNFKSRKEPLFTAIIWSFVLCIGCFLYVNVQAMTEIKMPLFILPILIILVLWVYYGTSYKIIKSVFYYKTGPKRGRILIEEIKSIHKNKTVWAGLRPATARNGLLITYSHTKEIYISPKNSTHFIEVLLKINPEIVVIN